MSGIVQVRRLYVSEIRLLARESQVLFFVFGFPAITVLVLGGVFGSEADEPGFEFVNPSHFYVTAYFGIVLAAIALIMLPAHVATYRERGLLRRYDSAGFARWVFPVTQYLCGLTFAAFGFLSLAGTAAVSYGMPQVRDGVGVALGLAVATLSSISIGVALGTLLPTARAAQGLGLALFFPMFLLAGGGPPPASLTDTMQSVARFLPLTHVVRAIQEPWLALGTGVDHLVIAGVVGVVSAAIWLGHSRRVSQAS